MRTIVIGDVHGCGKALRTLLEGIQPQADDTLVFLGDYVDRGPESREVIEQIIRLRQQCNVMPLRGNHEVMLLGIISSGLSPDLWLANGGRSTVSSYGGSISKIPQHHLDFLFDLLPYWETDAQIFLHANYLPHLPVSQQPEQQLYWQHLSNPVPAPHHSGKRVFLGHTPQISGEILDHGHLICLDTCCFGGGWLTAMEIESGKLWQANAQGHRRRRPLQELRKAFRRWWSRAKET